MNPSLKILFASSEVYPYSKTGGLADVSASLPQSLSRTVNVDVTVVTPFYRSVRDNFPELKTQKKILKIPFKGTLFPAVVFHEKINPNFRVYFIQCDEFFDRSELYGTAQGDYSDNAERFSYFSLAVLELCREFTLKPHIIHCNDWQTGLIPAYLKRLYGLDRDPVFRGTKTVFTIHNMAYQGIFPAEVMSCASIPRELFSLQGLEFYNKINLLKGGLVFADRLTTVSPKYAEEIQTPEFGHGLEGVLKERKKDLYGILNGIDYSIWDPKNDPHIAARFGPEDLTGKKTCKQALVKKLKLQGSEDSPLLSSISRLAEQKGIDLLIRVIPDLIDSGCLLIVLGSGDKRLENKLLHLSLKYKKKLHVHIGFDNSLAHEVEAGSDMFLMPSRYEPCGLNQLYSLKYGTIPIVRSTGGLDDTILEFNSKERTGNGFKFDDFSSKAFLAKIRQAIKFYAKKNIWTQLIKNAMSEDHSWERSARLYLDLYTSLINQKKG